MAAAPLRAAHLTRLRGVSRRVMLGQDMLGCHRPVYPGRGGDGIWVTRIAIVLHMQLSRYGATHSGPRSR